MTLRPRRRLLSSLAALILTALILALAPIRHAPLAAAWTLEVLMARLAAVPARHARFVEEKHLAALATPIEAHGELVYRRPAYLEKITTAPAPERLVVDGATLRFEHDGRVETFDLTARPELAALVEAVRGTLAGDLAGLGASYAVALAGDEGAWRLSLTPRTVALARLLRLVAVEGHGAEPERIDIIEADGDTARMRITPLP